jgi:hypothetical protein
MDQPLKWLPDVNGTAWESLGEAMRRGLPVPAGFIVFRSTPEAHVRAAYEELKVHEHTHFLALRGPTHPVLNVIGPDPLVHTLRRLWSESPEAPLLVQRMVHSMWCGRTQLDEENLRITANEGMMLLDPDTYVVNKTTGECMERILEPKQRKMIRHVDGTPKVVDREGERTPMPADLLADIAALVARAGSDIRWAIDDRENLWLLGLATKST